MTCFWYGQVTNAVWDQTKGTLPASSHSISFFLKQTLTEKKSSSKHLKGPLTPPPTCLQLLELQKQNILLCSSCRFLQNAPEKPPLGPWPEAVFHSWRFVIDNIFLPPSSLFHRGDATAYTSRPSNAKAKQSGHICSTRWKHVENSSTVSITMPPGVPGLAPRGPLCWDTPSPGLPLPSLPKLFKLTSCFKQFKWLKFLNCVKDFLSFYAA